MCDVTDKYCLVSMIAVASISIGAAQYRIAETFSSFTFPFEILKFNIRLTVLVSGKDRNFYFYFYLLTNSASFKLEIAFFKLDTGELVNTRYQYSADQ